MLMSLLTQNGKTPHELANNDEVKAAFAEHTHITDDNRGGNGIFSRLRLF